MKHEPIATDHLSQARLEQLTDPTNGSKFLATWPLTRVTDWVEQEVRRRGWRYPPGVRDRVKVRLGEPVGYVRGQIVRTITMHMDDRYVHAYPDEDD